MIKTTFNNHTIGWRNMTSFLLAMLCFISFEMKATSSLEDDTRRRHVSIPIGATHCIKSK